MNDFKKQHVNVSIVSSSKSTISLLGPKNVFGCRRIGANASRIERSEGTTSSGKSLGADFLRLSNALCFSVSLWKRFDVRDDRSLHSIRRFFQRTLSPSANDDCARAAGTTFFANFFASIVRSFSWNFITSPAFLWSIRLAFVFSVKMVFAQSFSSIIRRRKLSIRSGSNCKRRWFCRSKMRLSRRTKKNRRKRLNVRLHSNLMFNKEKKREKEKHAENSLVDWSEQPSGCFSSLND